MIYLDFKSKIDRLEVFSLLDIKKLFPNFDNRRLFEWQDKGYLIKLRNGWYCFSDIKKGEFFSYYTANRIYSPSYISLESALSYHNIIPEAVYSICSVSTNKTMIFNTPLGEFRYNTIKPSLFWGYEIFGDYEKPIKIANAEKAILDFLYLRKQYITSFELLNLRFSLDDISKDKLLDYLKDFKSLTLNKRVKNLIDTYAIV